LEAWQGFVGLDPANTNDTANTANTNVPIR
jgi:hypothetical protein